MNRLQTFHEALIPMLVEAVGARTYLELGTGSNETIARVRCERRIGVDANWVQCPGVTQFCMTTDKFIAEHAATHAPYDFCFMDASHRAEQVQKDFEGIWPLISPEGMLLIHDVQPETIADTDPGFCGDAWKFAKELRELGYESLVLNYHPGILLVRKRTTWGPIA